MGQAKGILLFLISRGRVVVAKNRYSSEALFPVIASPIGCSPQIHTLHPLVPVDSPLNCDFPTSFRAFQNTAIGPTENRAEALRGVVKP